MKSILSCIFILFFFTNCKKENTIFYMTGHIYNNCYDRIPGRNLQISLYRTNDGSNQGGEDVGTSTTDSTGYFKITFPSSSKFNTMKLQTSGGDIMEKIPPTGNIDNVEVFARIYSNIKVSLNVNNPHNTGDTLFIEKLDQFEFFKISCPLTNGTIYSVANYSPVNPQAYDGISDDLVYKFKSNPNNVYFKSFLIKQYCYDTVYVTVDIN